MIARATISRCAMPPDSAATGAFARSASRNCSSSVVASRFAVSRGHPEEAPVEVEVLPHGQRPVERVGLRHDADHLLRGDRVRDDVDAADERAAARGDHAGGEHAGGRGLARAVRAEQPEDLAPASPTGRARRRRGCRPGYTLVSGSVRITSSVAAASAATLLVSTLADTGRLLFVVLRRGEVLVDLHEGRAEDLDLGSVRARAARRSSLRATLWSAVSRLPPVGGDDRRAGRAGRRDRGGARRSRRPRAGRGGAPASAARCACGAPARAGSRRRRASPLQQDPVPEARARVGQPRVEHVGDGRWPR